MIYRPGAERTARRSLAPRTRDILLSLQDIARVHSGNPWITRPAHHQVRPGATSTPATWGITTTASLIRPQVNRRRTTRDRATRRICSICARRSSSIWARGTPEDSGCLSRPSICSTSPTLAVSTPVTPGARISGSPPTSCPVSDTRARSSSAPGSSSRPTNATRGRLQPRAATASSSSSTYLTALRRCSGRRTDAMRSRVGERATIGRQGRREARPRHRWEMAASRPAVPR